MVNKILLNDLEKKILISLHLGLASLKQQFYGKTILCLENVANFQPIFKQKMALEKIEVEGKFFNLIHYTIPFIKMF